MEELKGRGRAEGRIKGTGKRGGEEGGGRVNKREGTKRQETGRKAKGTKQNTPHLVHRGLWSIVQLLHHEFLAAFNELSPLPKTKTKRAYDGQCCIKTLQHSSMQGKTR